MKNILFKSLLVLGCASVSLGAIYSTNHEADLARALRPVNPDADNAGLKLPEGFGAIMVAQNIGQARHLAVTKSGEIYVKLSRLKDGKGILLLKDTNGDGKADQTTAFGNYGGTGMFLKNNYLYASSDQDVFRYKLDANEHVVDPENPEKIVGGLVNRRMHETKSIALDNNDNIYVNIGAYSNICQEQDRKPGSPGRPGCPILDSAGGIWQFKASKLNQQYGDGKRYATGLRNVVGLDWDLQTNSLFVMQHGRDGLQDYKDLYDLKTAVEVPAECMYQLKMGDNAGWPYIHYDPLLKKKIQSPEYGGDGKKEGDKKFIDPVAAYPAHMAPNGLLFYTGNMFPARYKNGAFIAFHGSWNRAPEPQSGYFVVFQPFKNGKPFGKWEVFADGFAGKSVIMATGQAAHRPCGLAQGPDGSLYVTDDMKAGGGSLYRIVYKK